MIGTKMLSVGMIAVAFVGLSGLASATSTPYVVPVGQTLDFTVPGSTADLDPLVGSATIVNRVDLGAGLERVSVKCIESLGEACVGFIMS